MRVLVCGGRNYTDRERLFTELDAIHAATLIDVIIEGGASGADNLAGSWARVRNVSSWRVPADWRLGRGAGHARNAKMLAMCEPALVVAFPGGAGTADMVRRARDAGVTVREVV
jgi:hypothetical protein